MLQTPIKTLLLFTILSSRLFAQQVDEKSLSLQYIDYLKNNKFHEAYQMTDTLFQHKLTEDMFRKTCAMIIVQFGNLNSYTYTKEEKTGPYNSTFTTCNYDKQTIYCELTFTPSLKIIGFHFVPIGGTGGYSPPPYDSAGSYTTKPITITTGEFNLPGILTLPAGIKNPPVAILVHGSGPNDRDESLGPNKTFKDLAIGLARKGIATIRYDKRTLVYGRHAAKNVHDGTVNDETIEDVLTAVKMADTMKGIDNKRIFVIGHSLGAMLAPRIASQSKKIKGIVMMAGDSRLLEDVMIYQMGYLASLDTNSTADKQKAKDDIIKKLQYAESPDLKPDAPDSLLPYGVSAPYWIDINHYNQVKTAQELKIPILILQGERDYQVTMEDFNLWKSKLGDHKNVTLKSYPRLNHLFMEGEGKGTPKEYEKPAHVPLYVITDIANWLNK